MRHLLGSTIYGLLVSALALGGALPLLAQSILSQSGSVAAGHATIGTPSNNGLTITQTSPTAVINRNSYSIGQPNTVIYNQPSSTSEILNRVAASTNYTLTYVGANLTVTAAISVPVPPPIVTSPLINTESAQLPAFPSRFTSNDFLGNGGDNGFASANFAADPDTSTCTPTGVWLSLSRYGRVDLTSETAASCYASSHKWREIK